MSSESTTPTPPEPTPIYMREWGEGEYAPTASAREIRELLNRSWRAVFSPNLANPEPVEEIAIQLQLATAEMGFRILVLDSERESSFFARDAVPAKYVDDLIRQNGQAAMEEGRRQGGAEQNEMIAAAMTAVLAHEAEDDTPCSLATTVREILDSQSRAAEYTAKIERAAYERGCGSVRDQVLLEIDKVVDRAAEAESKLEMIARAIESAKGRDLFGVPITEIEEVLES